MCYICVLYNWRRGRANQHEALLEVTVLNLSFLLKVAIFIHNKLPSEDFTRSLLKRSLPDDLLQGVNYSVLGWGDSSYPKYNYVAKRLYRRLQGLGKNYINFFLEKSRNFQTRKHIYKQVTSGSFYQSHNPLICHELLPLPF